MFDTITELAQRLDAATEHLPVSVASTNTYARLDRGISRPR